MKQIILPLLAASLMLTLGFCRHHPTTLETRTSQFDSCVTLGREAVSIANDAIRKLDSTVTLLEVWKYAALKCNPNIKISVPLPSPIPDTTKPTYQKFIRTNVSVQEYLYTNRIKDSIINAYRSEMGDKTLRMYFDMEDYLRTRSVLDSVKIGK
jgi:hypothetical protein